jgi:NTP pyrophosphatase (non-canonical NTP hydrolase)
MTESDKEVLRIAQEECAEVIQAISKVFRFGMDEMYEKETNKQRLEMELGDLLCMIELMIEKNLVNREKIDQCLLNKRTRLETWSNIFKEEAIQ